MHRFACRNLSASAAAFKVHKESSTNNLTASSEIPKHKKDHLLTIKLEVEYLANRSQALAACVDKLAVERAECTRQLGMYFEIDIDSVNDAHKECLSKGRGLLEAMTYLEMALESQAWLERKRAESGDLEKVLRSLGLVMNATKDDSEQERGPEGEMANKEDACSTIRRTTKTSRRVDELQKDTDLPNMEQGWRLEQIERLKWRR